MERRRIGEKQKLPTPCKMVSGKTVFLKDEKQRAFENHEWFYLLTKPYTDQYGREDRIGRDPKLVSAEILIKSGHPPRSATSRIRTYLIDMDLDRNPEKDKGLKRVRELCLACAVTTVEVRKCSIINCPLWCHRLGSNPHNFHKRHNRG